MARSSYVYIIQDAKNSQLLGGFTVKHEAIDWASRYSPGRRLLLVRMKDGSYGSQADKAPFIETLELE